ncbi:MAG: patatin-like phospholipase family protein [Aquabacterium sp.]|uniref:patatin-like phospholipase family protein n=1 Tax=Aquabacterium sp. TaxID=1872578 RepID=UPI0027201A31|nr:patatin-like phospholipase family protein [Aquabacterium sp.]MDO9005574.1 patatin-like phospholipase family protein [Aquabacterium sp.]
MILKQPLSSTPTPPSDNALPYEVVALVLQGGGALGSYQAGVVEGLHEAGIHPNWVAGISIGALNAAIIAGNPPELRIPRLREFWDTICQPAYFQPTADALQTWVEQLGGNARKAFNGFSAWRAMIEGQKDFFVPRVPPTWQSMNTTPDLASFYDTSRLKSTLERLVDFDRLNAGEIRVSVGAVNARTGNFEFFENTCGPTQGRMRPEHFMASGALPPSFPAVEIEGEFYWDGGLVSNTPLAHILSATPRRNTIAFQVDLWSSVGVLPTNIFDVQERIKDIQYSSRTRAITDMMEREQKYRRLLRDLLKHVPPEAIKADAQHCQTAQELACSRQTNVIHLIYRDKEWDGLSKDYEFGPITMRDHWTTGLDDIRHTLTHKEWLELPPEGKEFITHDLRRSERPAAAGR